MNERKASQKDCSTVSATNLEQDTCDAALPEEGSKTQDTRVSIHVHSIRKRLCDADGISAKAAIDGLVQAGILPDDDPKHVKEVTYSQEKGSEEKTIIEIYMI